jgi:hypothetical protein
MVDKSPTIMGTRSNTCHSAMTLEFEEALQHKSLTRISPRPRRGQKLSGMVSGAEIVMRTMSELTDEDERTQGAPGES